MKFFFKLLTKAKKIVKVLGYVYTGMLAAISALEVLIESLPEVKVKKFRKALKFITIGANALRTVLEWFGCEDTIAACEMEARNLTITEFQRELTIELTEEEKETKNAKGQ